MLCTVNRILDGVGSIMGAPSRMETDDRVSLARLRFKRGQGLSSVAVSMAEISRPIMLETLIEVREAQKAQRSKRNQRTAAASSQ